MQPLITHEFLRSALHRLSLQQFPLHFPIMASTFPMGPIATPTLLGPTALTNMNYSITTGGNTACSVSKKRKKKPCRLHSITHVLLSNMSVLVWRHPSVTLWIMIWDESVLYDPSGQVNHTTVLLFFYFLIYYIGSVLLYTHQYWLCDWWEMNTFKWASLVSQGGTVTYGSRFELEKVDVVKRLLLWKLVTKPGRPSCNFINCSDREAARLVYTHA